MRLLDLHLLAFGPFSGTRLDLGRQDLLDGFIAVPSPLQAVVQDLGNMPDAFVAHLLPGAEHEIIILGAIRCRIPACSPGACARWV